MLGQVVGEFDGAYVAGFVAVVGWSTNQPYWALSVAAVAFTASEKSSLSNSGTVCPF